MISLQVVFDGDLAKAVSMIRRLSMSESMETLFPEGAQATEMAANAVSNQWKQYAAGATLPDGQRVKQPDAGYVASIKVQRNGSFDYTVYTEHQKADFYENGMASYDMKKTHPNGRKSRVAKKRIPKRQGGGFRYVPYLVVPFRWATPKSGAHMGAKNVIPQQLYSRILSGMKSGSFQRTKVLDGKKMEPNYMGDMIERALYAAEDGLGSWGSRVNGSMLDGIEGLSFSQNGRTPNISGLSAMNDKGQTNYMTFRVISADSPSNAWIHPGVKGRHLAEQTANKMREDVNKLIESGFMASIKRNGFE